MNEIRINFLHELNKIKIKSAESLEYSSWTAKFQTAYSVSKIFKKESNVLALLSRLKRA